MLTQRTWKFPPEIDGTGRVRTLADDESLRQSIRLILATARGERLMRPEFGSDIQRFSFEVVNSATLALMRSSVREALLESEPRLEEVDVRVSTSALGEGALLLFIRYRERGAQRSEELEHTFSLTQ